MIGPADRGDVKPGRDGLAERLAELSPEKRRLLERVLQGHGVDVDRVVIRRREASGPVPLSFGQRRLWILDQLAPDSTAYNVAMGWRLRGELDRTALERSLNEIVRRHEVLRTTFPVLDGEPIQQIATELAVPLVEIDLSGLSEGERSVEARRLASAETSVRMDLARGPLVRARLLSLGTGDQILLLTIHHILVDAWSVGVLLRELAALYGAFRAGQASPLTELPVQYADFARWQREWLQGEVLESQLGYWRSQLAEPLPVLELPAQHARPTIQRFRAGVHSARLPKSLADELKELSRREGATLFMTLLAAFQALLHRYTGQEDVVVGSPIANRRQREVEGLIGFFVNSLVMRTNLSGNPSFRDLLGRVKRVALEAFAHQDLPFEKLVEELEPQRYLGQNPFFQVAFAVQNAPFEALSLDNLTLGRLDFEATTTRFDIEVHLSEESSELRATTFYSTDLYDAATIERMFGHYRTLLEAVVSQPDRPLSQLALLTSEEERRLVVEWNVTAREYPRDRCVHEVFEEQAGRTPEAVAAVFDGERLSYGELEERANRLAWHLRGLGVGADTRVGICCERSLEMVVGLLGILKAGGAYVPLDPSYPSERLAFMVADSGVGVLVTQEGLAGILPEHGARVVRLDADGEEIGRQSASALPSVTNAEHLAYVIYTSGSTGMPKGIAVTHRAVNRLVLNTDYVQVEPSDRIAQASNASFDAATFEIWGALLNGARLVGVSREASLSPRDLAAVLKEQGVTILFLTTALFNAVAREDVRAFSGLRHLLFGGEAVDPARVREVLEGGAPGRLLHVYGPTETTTYATWHLVEEVSEEATTVAIGRPIANTTAYVLDGRMSPVPVGVAGEFYLGGDGLARGYLGRPDLTAEKFVPDPFGVEPGRRLYRTGDLVRRRADGDIEFLGRIDHQVKLRGFRIELGEIEALLAKHPGVREAVVVAREDEPGEKRLVAYVTARDGGELDPSQLRSHVKEKLPEYMVPTAFVCLEALPLSPNGKVDRRALPVPDGRPEQEERYIAPRSEVETKIAAVWQDVLNVEKVGIRDNFFDLGGHSLLLLQVHGRLREEFHGKDLSIVDLFHYPTIQALAEHLSEGDGHATPVSRAREREKRRKEAQGEAIAIVGMAGRFPGARDVQEFWRNLRAGEESITFFTDVELEEAGTLGDVLRDGKYVKARGVLADVDLFDAEFFGYNPREAEIIDPQQRVFLETASEALERAGYDPEKYPGLIGVYGGITANSYVHAFAAKPDLLASIGGLAVLIGSDKDFLPTRVSYKLNLKGPAVTVQSACSTSLVAVHLACQGLLRHECDMALAGGVSIPLPQKTGYRYVEEGILSPDGHCRAFDAKAQGTVTGAGVGIVVLKRLQDALADGDTIEAVIKGTAINNDGSQKVGYTAPSVDGQAEVIAMALTRAGIDPETIGYVEAHGTGTTLGDPIEVEALGQVFRASTRKKRFCAIGSVKTNVGHLDAASGVTGLIKAALSLKHGEIPPSLHFEASNPRIDFEESPFFVNERLRAWTTGSPRRAAVSSFGIGGTNAHVVLEEAPARPATGPSRAWQLLVWSARSAPAVEQATVRLSNHLANVAASELADVSYTLQVGRREFAHRRAVVCRDPEDARRVLAGADPGRLLEGVASGRADGVAFLFPGQGSQHVGMCGELYRAEEAFRGEVDRCAELLREALGLDLREVLYPQEGEEEAAKEKLGETGLTQPALFVVEWALARLWMAWGVKPTAIIGHSIGEYVAACLSGVMSLEDALSLVAVRGRLMQGLPRGAMTAVALAEGELRPLLSNDLALAAVNAPAQCVVSGPVGAVEDLEQRLARQGVECGRLATSHAFHSGMLDPILEPFREWVSRVELQPPRVPYISNVTGTWIREEEATDPRYWMRHLRETVRFADGIEQLLSGTRRILLEVGPGQTLTGLARRQSGWGSEQIAVSSLRHPREKRSDGEALLTALGLVWLAGVDVDWTGHRAGERRRRVPLPTYAFQRQRYWIDVERPIWAAGARPPARRKDVGEWFYVPSWKRSRPLTKLPSAALPDAPWLVFADDCGLARALVERLAARRQDVVTVVASEAYARLGPDQYCIDPGDQEHYEVLATDLKAQGRLPSRVLHLWGVTARDVPCASLERSQDVGFYSLLFLARALANADPAGELGIAVVTSQMQEVSGEGLVHPEKATVLGPTKVIPREYPGIRCRSIDIVVPARGSWSDEEQERLLAECAAMTAEPVVALRGIDRWVQTFEPVRLEATDGPPARLRHHGVYLVTGGLGGIGLELAEYLARSVKAKLVLVGRSAVPPREEWDAWLARDGAPEITSRRIRKLRDLEALGSEVLVLRADVSQRSEMEETLRRAEERFGHIDGVIHSAGVAGGGIIQLKTRAAAAAVLAPKLKGALVLDELLRARRPDFVLFCSSLASVLGGAGQADYVAANAFLDALARRNTAGSGPFTVSVNWDTWSQVGMAVDTAVPLDAAEARRLSLEKGIHPEEGRQAFGRILGQHLPQVLTSVTELDPRLTGAAPHAAADTSGASRSAQVPPARPELEGEYVAPRNEVEQAIAAIWQEFLGFERVGVHDSFFDLGGHSLLATRIASRLRETFQVALTLETLFQAPTVAELAACIVAKETQPGQAGEIARLLQTVDEMSPAEVRAQLAEQSTAGSQA